MVKCSNGRNLQGAKVVERLDKEEGALFFPFLLVRDLLSRQQDFSKAIPTLPEIV